MKRLLGIACLLFWGMSVFGQQQDKTFEVDSLLRVATVDSLSVADSLCIRDTTVCLPSSVQDRPDTTVSVRRRPVVGVSTNLLYDFTYIPNYGLTSIPSLSVEYYPSRYGRFSFGADVEWPMWRHAAEHRYLQIQNITLHGRWYFMKNYRSDYRGPYALVNANVARYGIGWQARGWEGEGLGGSLGLGYKHSLFGSGRLYWDAGLALGVFYTSYDPYVWGDDGTGWYYYDYVGDPKDFIVRNHFFLWGALPTRIWFAIGIDLFNRRQK